MKKSAVFILGMFMFSGDKRVDLTDKGFMYANESPDKLKAEIKKAVDGFLKL
jgi:hypothetical protein